jgi:DNA replication protein DnaC
MDNRQLIRQYCQQFKMGGLQSGLDQLIKNAEASATGYLEFTASLLQAESTHRERNELHTRLKVARLPRTSDLSAYNHNADNGLTKTRMNQLRELNWLDQVYNIILMGPSGTGKTYLAAGLCAEAVHKGYKAYFRTMEELINMLKMKDFARSAKGDYKRLCKASLIVIDDIMLFPVEKNEAVNLFNFINQLYETTCFIVTTNKKPADWAEMLGDEVLATALLDRLLYRCEVINLTGKSYRLQNRQTIFLEQNN